MLVYALLFRKGEVGPMKSLYFPCGNMRKWLIGNKLLLLMKQPWKSHIWERLKPFLSTETETERGGEKLYVS